MLSATNGYSFKKGDIMSTVARKPAKTDPLQALAERKLQALAGRARRFPALKSLAPGSAWIVEVSIVSSGVMKKLNAQYRGKDYATDVLSFTPPVAIRAHGVLGELVICGSVLERQAREFGHKPELELEILLVHGLLHLLGFDHELGARAAQEMRVWEGKLLGRAAKRGLIARVE